MTPAERTCPECGAGLPADAVRGICPRCLLRRALEADLAGEVSRVADRTIHLVLPEDAGAFATLPFRELGDYELLAEIGRGGMGIIYQARQRSLDRLVAIKLIRSGSLARSEDIARFRNEAAAAARLKHPRIVAIHEVGEHEGHHFYSMDFVPGRSLSAVLREGPFTPKRAAQCVRTVAEAIHFAHEHGVLHRDLKPSNILLDAEDEPHVADFGLAKLLHSDSELTLTGMVLGSPNYMPPEQARGKHAEVSARSDVYSLGAILYECLTGRPPFSAATPLETMKLVVEQEPVSPRVLNPSLPGDLETICLKCLAKEPSTRYATAQELADELGRFLNDEPIRARHAGFAERAVRWCRRKPALAALFAVIVAATVALVAVLASSNTRVRHALGRAVSEGERASNALARVELEVTRTAAAASRAEAGERSAQLNLYAADMAQTWRAVEDGNLGQARTLLQAHRPKPGELDLRGFEWRLFWRMAQGEGWSEICPATNKIQTVALAPDGRRLFTGNTHRIHVWDFERSQPDGSIPASIFDPLSSAPELHILRLQVTSPGFARDTEVLKSEGGLYRGTNPYHAHAEERLRISPDQRWVVSNDQNGVPLIWDLPSRRWVSALRVRAGDTSFWPGRTNWLAVGSLGTYGREKPDAIVVYDLTTREELRRFPGAGHRFGFSPDGRWICAYDQQDRLKLLDTTNETNRWIRGISGAREVVVSPDQRRILVLRTAPTSVSILNFKDGATIFELGHQASVLSAAFSPDGQWLATGGRDQSLRLWDLVHRTEARRFQGHADTVAGVVFAPDGRSVYSAGTDGRVLRWDLSALREQPRFTGLQTPFIGSADDRHHVALNKAGQLISFDLITRTQQVVATPFSNGMFLPLVFKPAGRSVLLTGLTASNAHPSITWFDVGTGANTPLQTLAWSRPGSLLRGATADGSVLAGEDEERKTLFWHKGQTHRTSDNGSSDVAFSPDGSLAVEMVNDRLHVRDTATWRVRFQHTAPGYVMKVVFSPDSALLAVVASANTTSLLDSRTGRVVATFAGHAARLRDVAIAPDGRTLVSTGEDATVRLWHVATRRELAVLQRGTASSEVWFSPSGRWLLTRTEPSTSYLCWEAGNE